MLALGLHVEPPEGIDAVMARGGTVVAGLAKPRKGPSSRRWFRADPTLWQRVLAPNRTYEREAVGACIALLPEIESWWHVQQPSEHIITWPVTYAGRTTPAVSGGDDAPGS